MSEFDSQKPGGKPTLSVPPSEDSWDFDEFSETTSAPPAADPNDITLSPVSLEPTFNTRATSKTPDPDPDAWDSGAAPRFPASSPGEAQKSLTPAVAGDDWDLAEFSEPSAPAPAAAASAPAAPAAAAPAGLPADDEPVAMADDVPPADASAGAGSGDGWDLDEFSASPPAPAAVSAPPVTEPLPADDEPVAMDDSAPPSLTPGDDWDMGEFTGSVPPGAASVSAPPAPEPVPVVSAAPPADDEPVAMADDVPPPDAGGGDGWDLNEFSASAAVASVPPVSAPPAPTPEPVEFADAPADESGWDLGEFSASQPAAASTPPQAVSAPAAAPLPQPVQEAAAPAAAAGDGWDTDEFASDEPAGTPAAPEPAPAAASSGGGDFDQILEVEDRDAYLDTAAAEEPWSVQTMQSVGQTLVSGTPPERHQEPVMPAEGAPFAATGNERIDSVLARLAAQPESEDRNFQLAAVYVAAAGQGGAASGRWLSEARQLLGERTDTKAAELKARVAIVEESNSDELERLGSAVGGGARNRAPWIAEALRRAVAEGADERAVRLAWALGEIDPGHPLARWVQARHLPQDQLADIWDDYLARSGTSAGSAERGRLLAADLRAGRKPAPERQAAVLAGLRAVPADDPLSAAAREYETEILELAGDREGWAAAMRGRAGRLAGEERTAVLYRLARVLHEDLGRLDEAREIYESIRQAEPENLLVLKLLEDVERRTGRADELLAVLDAQYRQLNDPQLRAITAVKGGQVADELLRQPQTAIEWYSRALEVDPRNPFALSSIGRLFARAGEWEKLAQVYEFEAEGSPDRQQRIDFMLKHAELLADRLNQRKMAIDVLRTALLVDDSNLNIYRELGRLLYAEKQWEDLIRLYQAESTLTRDKSRLVAIYMSLGELWQKDFQPSEPVDKFAQAVENYYHALEVDPEYTPALRTLGRLFHSTGNWDLLIRIFEREMELVEAPQAKAGIYIKVSEIAEDRKKDIPLAIEYLRKALELDPENQMVINHLSRLSPALKNWDDLVQVYIREAQMTKDPRYAAALHQLIGEIWRDRFRFGRKSNESFERALELDPALSIARHELDEGRASDVAPPERIRALAEALEENASPELAGRFVDLLAANPSEITSGRIALIPDAAVSRALLAFQPLLDAALLRSLAERAASTGGPAAAAARQILIELPGTDEIAETAYIETLLREGTLTDADIQRIYARISARKPSLGHWELKAALWPRLGPGTDELDALIWEGIGIGGTSSRLLPLLVQRAEAGPASPGILEALRQAAAETGDAGHELMAVEKLFEQSLDPQAKEKLLESKARALSALEGRQEEALAAARELFHLNPDHPAAAELISKLSTELGRSDDARLFAERRLAKAETSAEKALAKTELARIAFELEKNPAEATALLGDALALDSGCLDARRYLLTMAERQADPQQMAAALEGLEPFVETAERLQIRERLASIYGDELKEPERQLLHLEELARVDASNALRFAQLVRFHRGRSDWPELARNLLRQARVTDDAPAAERLVIEAARIAVDRRLPEEDLESLYQWCRDRLVQATDQPGVLAAAVDTARALDLAPELAQMLEQRAALAGDESRQVADLIEAAKLYETVLDNKAKAQDLYAAAAELDDTHPAALMAQAEKLFRDEQFAKALPVFRKAFGAGIQKSEPRVRSEANYMMGVCLRQTGDNEQARGAFLRVIEDNPSHRDALLALAEFDAQRQDWASFGQRLEIVLKSAADDTPAFRANIWTRMAHAYEKAGKPDDALKAWEGVMRENPSSEDALQAVALLASSRGYIDRANTALEGLAGQYEALMENQKAAKCRLEIARNLEKHLNDPQQALIQYRRALDLDGTAHDAAVKVAEADLASGNADSAAALLQKLVKAPRLDPKLLAAANGLLGKAALAKGDTAAAQAYLEQAGPQAGDAGAEQMIAVYEKNGEWEKASQALEKLIDQLRKDNPRASLPLLLRRASILKERLNRRDDAIMEIRRAIRLDPQNVQLHETLAAIFRDNPSTLGEAVKSYHALLQIDPFHTKTYETLGIIYATDLDKKYCSGQALVALGIATADIGDFVSAQRGNQPAAPKTKQNPQLAGKPFWHPNCQNFLQEFLPQLAPAITRAYPMDFVKLGVKPDPMPPAMVPEPVKAAMEQIGPVEGLIFVRDNRRPLQMSIERGTKGPVVLIGDQLFETVTGPEAVFVASRTLFQLLDGTYALNRLDGETIHRLLALFGRAVDETFKMGGDPAAIKRDVKTVDKEISRTLKKELQAKLPKFREAHSRVVMNAWLEGMQYSRDRFGLVMCGDLQAALTRIAVRAGAIQQGPLPRPEEWPGLFRDRPHFGELLRYSVSEEYFLQRRAFGMSLDSI